MSDEVGIVSLSRDELLEMRSACLAELAVHALLRSEEAIRAELADIDFLLGE